MTTTVTTGKESQALLERRQRVEGEIDDLIEKGTKVWESVAKRLQQIHDDASWTIDHKSWKAYIHDRWGKSPQWAYQLMRSRTLMLTMGKTKKQFRSERSVRELASVPEESRAKVAEVAAKDGEVTSTKVKEAAQAKPVSELDKTGYPIPEDLMELWERQGEIEQSVIELSSIRNEVEQAQKDEDPLYTGVSFSGLLADLSKAITGLKEALPYCVCTQCQGRFYERCVFCKGKGFISKFKFQTQTPEEMREMRLKLSKKK